MMMMPQAGRKHRQCIDTSLVHWFGKIYSPLVTTIICIISMGMLRRNFYDSFTSLNERIVGCHQNLQIDIFLIFCSVLIQNSKWLGHSPVLNIKSVCSRKCKLQLDRWTRFANKRSGLPPWCMKDRNHVNHMPLTQIKSKCDGCGTGFTETTSGRKMSTIKKVNSSWSGWVSFASRVKPQEVQGTKLLQSKCICAEKDFLIWKCSPNWKWSQKGETLGKCTRMGKVGG